MQDIIIYGAGGFGREVNFLIRQINANRMQWRVKGFCDDGKKVNDVIDGVPVLGGYTYLLENKRECVVLAVGDPRQRKNIFDKISGEEFVFPNLIHPEVYFDDTVNRIGKGCIITGGCYFTTGIQLGNFVIVNLGCTIGHDVTLKDFSAIMPGVNISGNVSVGESTLIGTGAVILQSLSIGSNATLGAGAVMTKTFGDNCVLTGVPAQRKK